MKPERALKERTCTVGSPNVVDRLTEWNPYPANPSLVLPKVDRARPLWRLLFSPFLLFCFFFLFSLSFFRRFLFAFFHLENLEKCLLVHCLLKLWLVVCVFRVCLVVSLEESPTSDLAVATRSHSPMPMIQGGLCRVMQRRRQCLASTSRPPRTNRDQF